MAPFVDLDPYLINGVALGTWAWRISAVESEAPDWRDTGIAVPGAHGELDPGSDPTGQRRPYMPGQLKLQGWVQGVDPLTGSWTGNGLGPYLARQSELVRLLSARNLTIEHQRPDGSRFADGYRSSGFAPSREPASPWFGRFEVTIKIPGAFWRGASTITVGTPVGGSVTGTAIELSAFPNAGAEAPTADGVLTFGASSNPTWTHAGAYCRYAGVIAAGRTLLIDMAVPEVRAGAGAAWTPDPGLIQYGPGPSWYELDPAATPQAVLTHTGGGNAFASFAGKPKHLTS